MALLSIGWGQLRWGGHRGRWRSLVKINFSLDMNVQCSSRLEFGSKKKRKNCITRCVCEWTLHDEAIFKLISKNSSNSLGYTHCASFRNTFFAKQSFLRSFPLEERTKTVFLNMGWAKNEQLLWLLYSRDKMQVDCSLKWPGQRLAVLPLTTKCIRHAKEQSNEATDSDYY